MHSKKKWGTKRRALSNSIINMIFLRWLPSQSHAKPSTTEKRWNKAQSPTRNSVRLQFVKETSMPNPVEILEYTKCCSSSSPRPIKAWQIYQIQVSQDLQLIENTWKSEKRPHLETTYLAFHFWIPWKVVLERQISTKYYHR